MTRPQLTNRVRRAWTPVRPSDDHAGPGSGLTDQPVGAGASGALSRLWGAWSRVAPMRPGDRRRHAAPVSVPAETVKSSTIRAVFPYTSPMISRISARPSCALRYLAAMAKEVPRDEAYWRACFTKPLSGETTTSSGSSRNLFAQDRQCVEVVHGDAEEALDLWGVQVKRHHTICAGHFDCTGTDTGTD
jgi:hypothetical protein